ncbi:hypothetical protein HN51_062542, partial [Arachis hypogaea]
MKQYLLSKWSCITKPNYLSSNNMHVTLLFNFILTFLTIAFAVHEYRTNKIARYSSVTFALTW